MEILYIYIHDYKKIQKQNINFGGKYRFHYDYESKELTVSENDRYIEGFYDKHPDGKGYAKITNVTSIIGENGVGKTSVLDFICDNLDRTFEILDEMLDYDKSGEDIAESYSKFSKWEIIDEPIVCSNLDGEDMSSTDDF
jgi:AAA15 family ATPase/GTPase